MLLVTAMPPWAPGALPSAGGRQEVDKVRLDLVPDEKMVSTVAETRTDCIPSRGGRSGFDLRVRKSTGPCLLYTSDAADDQGLV